MFSSIEAFPDALRLAELCTWFSETFWHSIAQFNGIWRGWYMEESLKHERRTTWWSLVKKSCYLEISCSPLWRNYDKLSLPLVTQRVNLLGTGRDSNIHRRACFQRFSNFWHFEDSFCSSLSSNLKKKKFFFLLFFWFSAPFSIEIKCGVWKNLLFSIFILIDGRRRMAAIIRFLDIDMDVANINFDRTLRNATHRRSLEWFQYTRLLKTAFFSTTNFCWN